MAAILQEIHTIGYLIYIITYIIIFIHSSDASAGNKTRLRSSVLDLHGPTIIIIIIMMTI